MQFSIFQFLHLHKIVEGIYFHCSLYVCVSVCLCVCECVWMLVNKIPVVRMHQFSLNGCLLYWLEPYWYWWPWIKSRSQWSNLYFFLYNSLSTSSLSFSALLCSIKMKFGMPLRYALSRLDIYFHKNRTGDDVTMTSFIFSVSEHN